MNNALRSAILISTSIFSFPTSAEVIFTEPPQPSEVLTHYSDIAEAVYDDSLTKAKDLQTQVESFLANPTTETLDAARKAWIAARAPYQQSEVYRFGNPIVDEWEGGVNAWPLDEGLIDYVANDPVSLETNPFAQANIVANTELQIYGETRDISQITPELIRSLNEFEGIEANVATGYHAIEFLLWGQDLNGTKSGAGERPATDYDLENCTNGNCDRRADYLRAATDLLVSDLEEMVANWQNDGAARQALFEDENKGIDAIFSGMGSLSFGELAGQRMQLGLMLHDPEEEHDCFSDQTHMSHYYDDLGVQNVWLGRYERVNGELMEGPSPYDLVIAQDPQLAQELSAEIRASLEAMQELVDRAQNVEAYDQMLAPGNVEGGQTIQKAIDALIAQTKNIERADHLLTGNQINPQIDEEDAEATEVFQ